jgi:hypothetical protein
MVNDDTLSLFCQVLNFPDDTIASGVEATLDAEVLLDFILCVRSVFIASSRTIDNLFPLATA